MQRRTLLQMGAGITLAGSVAKGATKDRREELYGLLGDLPPKHRPVTAKSVFKEDRGPYVLEKLVLDLNGIEPAPAYFVTPKNASGKMPAVLFNHSHGGGYKIGKEEFINGREYMFHPPYAEFLASLGYCALCFDTWMFGERSTRTELDTFKDMLWHGQVLWGMMVYDSLQAIDYLTQRPEVDTARMATVGMSMGSDMAQWVAALDERMKVCVDICCLTDWQSLIEANGLHGHGIYYYVPSLLKHFSTAQMNALITPRAHLSLAGNQDQLTPVPGLIKIDTELQRVYSAAGHPENWRLLRYDGKHQEQPVMREEIRKWFVEKL